MKIREVDDLSTQFQTVMESLCPGWIGYRWVCAFSGGADSTSLLCLLSEGLETQNLAVAHLDHGLREESAREAEEVKGVAASIGLDFRLGTSDVRALAQKRGKGLEEAARIARYEFLEDYRRELNFDYIVTGHQAEDQAETIIMKLIRGAGPGGLAGIAAKRERIIRPLLGFSREELKNYLIKRGQTWIEDGSNKEVRFTRNMVRLEIMPGVLKLNPAALVALGRASRIATAEEEFWSQHLENLSQRLVTVAENGWLLAAADLVALTVAEQRRLVGWLLRRIVLPVPGGGEEVSLLAVETVLNFLGHPGAGGLDLPSGRRVEWSGHCIYLGPASRYKSRSCDK